MKRQGPTQRNGKDGQTQKHIFFFMNSNTRIANNTYNKQHFSSLTKHFKKVAFHIRSQHQQQHPRMLRMSIMIIIHLLDHILYLPVCL